MGVLLQAFFFGSGRVHGVPPPLDGDKTVPFWWDHLAAQANMLRGAGFTALWIPLPTKGRVTRRFSTCRTRIWTMAPPLRYSSRAS
jgi:hypothetical protein